MSQRYVCDCCGKDIDYTENKLLNLSGIEFDVCPKCFDLIYEFVRKRGSKAEA
jgi:Zn-finger nucleic acid-binding protein